MKSGAEHVLAELLYLPIQPILLRSHTYPERHIGTLTESHSGQIFFPSMRTHVADEVT